MSLKNKVCIITGSGSGIGRGAATKMAQQGAKVVLIGRTAEKIEAVKDQIEADGGIAKAFVLDVADHIATHKMAKETLNIFGRIDILVNNAGIYTGKSIKDITLEDWVLGLAVNLTAPMLMSKLAIPMMIKKGGGVILNITSGSAERYDRGHVAYSTSKAALNRFTQNLAQEVNDLNIVVNALGPGLVKTEMNNFYEHGDEIESVIEPALKLMNLDKNDNINGEILHKEDLRLK